MIWLGLRYPNVSPDISRIYFLLAALLVLPVVGLRGFWRNRAVPALVLVTLLVFLGHAYLTLIRGSGAKLTTPPLVILSSLSWAAIIWHNSPRPSVIQIAATLAYAVYFGAILAGNVQFATVWALGLVLAQIGYWELTGGREDRRWSLLVVLAGFVLPLAIMIWFRVGHGLAVPLIGAVSVAIYAQMQLLLQR